MRGPALGAVVGSLILLTAGLLISPDIDTADVLGPSPAHSDWVPGVTVYANPNAVVAQHEFGPPQSIANMQRAGIAAPGASPSPEASLVPPLVPEAGAEVPVYTEPSSSPPPAGASVTVTPWGVFTTEPGPLPSESGYPVAVSPQGS